MSDFLQHGLICTLHRLNPAEPVEDGELNETVLGLLLPCHLRDIGSKALLDTIKALNRLTWLQHIIHRPRRHRDQFSDVIDSCVTIADLIWP